jgi:hypothetical protein
MKYKLSLCLAGIRPHFWKRLYDSALTSCTRYPFELVIVSPCNLPEELKNIHNIKHIKDFGNQVRATQIGLANCEGELWTNPCDDGVFLSTSLDQAIDLWNAVAKPNDGMVMRYLEGSGMSAKPFPLEYWNARYHISVQEFHLGYDWKIAPQMMTNLEYIKSIGGFDSLTFETMAFPCHDTTYRISRAGGTFHLSPSELMDCDNHGEHGATSKIDSHSAIFYAQTQKDWPAFCNMYRNPDVKNRIHIDFDNWKQSPEVWTRRWGNKTVAEIDKEINGL